MILKSIINHNFENLPQVQFEIRSLIAPSEMVQLTYCGQHFYLSSFSYLFNARNISR